MKPVFGEITCPPHKWVRIEDPDRASAVKPKKPEAAKECVRCGRVRMDEAMFRVEIVNLQTKNGRPGLADQLGWEHVGFRPAKTQFGWRTPGTGTMAKGWPDLTLVHPRTHRILFVELKGDDGKLDAEQERVLAVLRSLPPPVEVHVWYPDDLETAGRVLMP